jgi:hypothetical protein
MFGPSTEKRPTFWPEGTLALCAPALAPDVPVPPPTCPGTSSPWPHDCALGGWSARMFLHQMLCASRPGWRSSDTESLLSRSTLATLRARVGGGSSLSAALLPSSPDSPGLYLTPPMVSGLLRRALKRRRPLQHVLLRTPAGWLRRTLTVSSRGAGYALSIPSSANPSRGSPEAGLLAFLAQGAGPCSATP